jgi:hypothetical protein
MIQLIKYPQTSSEVDALDIPYDSPDDFHSVRAELRDVDGSTVGTSFYLDGEFVTTQYGSEFVGKAFYLFVLAFDSSWRTFMFLIC